MKLPRGAVTGAGEGHCRGERISCDFQHLSLIHNFCGTQLAMGSQIYATIFSLFLQVLGIKPKSFGLHSEQPPSDMSMMSLAVLCPRPYSTSHSEQGAQIWNQHCQNFRFLSLFFFRKTRPVDFYVGYSNVSMSTNYKSYQRVIFKTQYLMLKVPLVDSILSKQFLIKLI